MNMKRLFMTIVAIVMAAARAQSEVVEIDGILYDVVDNSATVIKKIPQYTGDVVIPARIVVEGVECAITTIEDEAFRNCTGLTSVTIPSSVNTIGYEAFRDCKGLTSVNIPSSVTTIGTDAFHGCTGLTSLSVDSRNGVYDSRENCNAIIETSMNLLITGCQNSFIPSSVNIIVGEAFAGCTGLASLTIPSSVAIIGNGAFDGCTGLTSLTIHEGVTTIGERAFKGCTGLTSLTIPPSVTTIESQAFKGCTGMTSVTIPPSVSTINGEVFRGCTGLTSVNIPSSVSTIMEYAFSGCSGLTSVTIPSFVTTIGNAAFSGCKGLPTVVIPSSVTIIGAYAFSGCSSLASVVIPSSVTSIWDEAFRGCTELADVYCYAERVPRTVVDVFNGSPIESSTLHVPALAIDNYREAMPWSRFGKIVAIGNEDAVTQVKAVPMMIQAVGGALRIDGVQAGTPIDVYDLCGLLIANTMAIGNSTRVAVPTGEKMVVVKVGERAVKVRR